MTEGLGLAEAPLKDTEKVRDSKNDANNSNVNPEMTIRRPRHSIRMWGLNAALRSNSINITQSLESTESSKSSVTLISADLVLCFNRKPD